MATQTVAGALDLDNDSVMQELVEQCGRDDWIADDFAPFREPAVRSEDHGALFVASVDELEEQVSATDGDRQVTDLADDQQRRSGIETDLLREPALALSLAQRCDQIGQGCAIDALPGLRSGDAEGRGRIRLAGAWRPKEVNDLGPPDEVQLGQRGDPLPVERWLEAEVKALKGLGGHEFGGAQRHVDIATISRPIVGAQLKSCRSQYYRHKLCLNRVSVGPILLTNLDLIG